MHLSAQAQIAVVACFDGEAAMWMRKKPVEMPRDMMRCRDA